eukprot:CAMPEP_0113235176 /NCGR_PEP_ID=MMETSP0008_2-20120614/3419_1 /TAXON_ID=97485 /ORGANISM="Prymnesium parvum" /LENGTH=57 /DNA_ID=CAMNT_0000082091 /DNA_START=240 /DNA_END=409 /DNA_ORIENTATION=+ /assembly_acc=CAM_ASM_000153
MRGVLQGEPMHTEGCAARPWHEKSGAASYSMRLASALTNPNARRSSWNAGWTASAQL